MCVKVKERVEMSEDEKLKIRLQRWRERALKEIEKHPEKLKIVDKTENTSKC